MTALLGSVEAHAARIGAKKVLAINLVTGERASIIDESLRERYGKQLPPKLMDLVASKAPAGARPHHNFHVFDVWRTVEHLAGDVLATMDNCRISWGTVQAVEGADVVVERRPLALNEGKLALGEPQRERATRLFEGQGFVQAVAPGDTVSLHWGWVCEVLSARQVRALAHLTQYHLALASQTI